MQKRHQYNVNQIKQILQQNNLTVAKADKSKALVIIDRTALTHKVHKFIHENDMVQLNKDPTETYHKQIQIAIQNSEDLIDKNRRKYLLNIKPTAPKLNAYIKTHKENEPIRPVIDNTQAPAYKTAKFIGKQIKIHINLPNMYVTTNSKELARELHRLVTLQRETQNNYSRY